MLRRWRLIAWVSRLSLSVILWRSLLVSVRKRLGIMGAVIWRLRLWWRLIDWLSRCLHGLAGLDNRTNWTSHVLGIRAIRSARCRLGKLGRRCKPSQAARHVRLMRRNFLALRIDSLIIMRRLVLPLVVTWKRRDGGRLLVSFWRYRCLS